MRDRNWEVLLATLTRAARRDPRIRDALKSAGRAMLDLIPPEVTDTGVEKPTQKTILEPPEALPPLTLGQSSLTIDALSQQSTPTPLPAPTAPIPVPNPRAAAVDLESLGSLFRLQVDAYRWSAKRQELKSRRNLDFDADIKPTDDALLARARKGKHWIRALKPDMQVFLPDLLIRQAELYENTAQAVSLALLLEQSAGRTSETWVTPLQSIAEAQSACRNGINDLHRERDSGLERLFDWLRGITDPVAGAGVLVPRYMRLEDPADPNTWRRVRDELERLTSSLAAEAAKRKRVTKLWKKLNWDSKQLLEGIGDEERQSNWQKVINTVDELCNLGIAKSDVRFREPLLQILEEAIGQESESAAWAATLDELDQEAERLANRSASSLQGQKRTYSDQVLQIANQLRDRVAVIVGGEPVEVHRQRIQDAFDLRELRWLASPKHASTASLETAVRRPDVDIVLILIRWMSHSTGYLLGPLCNELKLPLIRVKSGYNEERLAHDIAVQVGRMPWAEPPEVKSAE